MARQFANYVRLIPLEYVDTITNGVITPKSGYVSDLLFAGNNLIPVEDPSDWKGNPCYKQSVKLITDKLSAELSARYRNDRRVIVQLFVSDGSSVIWGDLAVPVRVTLSPKPDKDVLDLTRTSPDSIL